MLQPGTHKYVYSTVAVVLVSMLASLHYGCGGESVSASTDITSTSQTPSISKSDLGDGWIGYQVKEEPRVSIDLPANWSFRDIDRQERNDGILYAADAPGATSSFPAGMNIGHMRLEGKQLTDYLSLYVRAMETQGRLKNVEQQQLSANREMIEGERSGQSRQTGKVITARTYQYFIKDDDELYTVTLTTADSNDYPILERIGNSFRLLGNTG